MRIGRWVLSAAAVAIACLAGGQAAALGSAGNQCLGSSAKRINSRDVRSFKCVIGAAQKLRESALTDAQSGFSQCQTEAAASSEDQVWDTVDQDGSDLATFADEGLTAAVDSDGNLATGLASYKPAYKGNAVKTEELDTAIRSLTNAKSYTTQFKKKIAKAAADLQSHDCHGVQDEVDPGGATGAQGRDRDAHTSESNAVAALEELAK